MQLSQLLPSRAEGVLPFFLCSGGPAPLSLAVIQEEAPAMPKSRGRLSGNLLNPCRDQRSCLMVQWKAGMIPDFPGCVAWMAAGLPEKELLEAWPHLAAYFGGHLLTSSPGNKPVRVPFLGGGSGLSLWPSLEQEAELDLLLPLREALPPPCSPPSPLAERKRAGNEAIPTPGWENLGIPSPEGFF